MLKFSGTSKLILAMVELYYFQVTFTEKQPIFYPLPDLDHNMQTKDHCNGFLAFYNLEFL